jgi:hypothetical protein
MGNDKVGRKLLSNWYASTVGQTSFNEGKNLILKSTVDDTGKYTGKDMRLGPAAFGTTNYRLSYSSDRVNDLVSKLKTGTTFHFYYQDSEVPDTFEYLLNGVKGEGWYMTSASEESIKKGNNFIGPTAQDVVKDVLIATDQPIFNSIVTEYEGNEQKANIDISTGEVQNAQKSFNTILKEIFMKEEEEAIKDLKKLLPSNYTLVEKGADMFGIDAIKIFDEEDNAVGTFGFDYDNPRNAANAAKLFFARFGPEGKNVLINREFE